MDNLKCNENVCRICLEHNANFSWNAEIITYGGVSYKDCYYKYTQLEEPDPDYYPRNLCDKCVNEVRNAYILFERALESFEILRNVLEAKGSENCCIKPLDVSRLITQNCSSDENYFIKSPTEDKSYIEIDEVTNFPLALDDTIEQPEKSNISCEEIPTNEIINIKIFKSSFDNPLQEQPIDIGDIKHLKLSINKNGTKKRRGPRIRGNELLKSTNKISTNVTNACKSLNRISIKQQQIKRQNILTTENTNECNQRKCTKGPISSSELFIEKSFENQKDIRETECHLLKPNFKDSERISSKHSKAKTFFKSALTKKDETINSSYNSLIETNISEGAKVSLSPCTIKRFELAGPPQTSSESNKSSKEKINQRSQNSLLEEIYGGENTEENSLERIKTKQYNLCQYCPYKSKDKRSLLEHENTHLDKRERNITCSICGVKFYTKVALKCHMETHNENRTKKHKCEFCEKAFFNKGALNVHRRIHLGLMFKCQICHREFFRRLDLDRHLIKHSVAPAGSNVEKKEYVVECQYCNKPILTRKLKEHMAIHMNKPQAKCKICDKDFFTKTRCTSHLRRFHKIRGSDYVNYIHNYVKTDTRTCFLKIRQEAEVKLLTK